MESLSPLDHVPWMTPSLLVNLPLIIIKENKITLIYKEAQACALQTM
jgi:hypothetical protein